MWITFWITGSFCCERFRDNCPCAVRQAKVVPFCPDQSDGLSEHFFVLQKIVLFGLICVIHRNDPALLTTTMFTYSKPYKTLNTSYQRAKTCTSTHHPMPTSGIPRQAKKTPQMRGRPDNSIRRVHSTAPRHALLACHFMQ